MGNMWLVALVVVVVVGEGGQRSGEEVGPDLLTLNRQLTFSESLTCVGHGPRTGCGAHDLHRGDEVP